jgi:dolichol-phosphate mannosyltransferase
MRKTAMEIADPSPNISVIVPTLNEAANLPPLLQRIALALAPHRYEVIVVDDRSEDNTAAVCADLGRRYPLTLLSRPRSEDGLSGAVVHGLDRARGEFLVVMDADLQHPPEKIPRILAPLRDNSADFVIGSRYCPGGSMQQSWGLLRRVNSRVATVLARPFAGNARDPMSGFFALRRQTYLKGEYLTPLGYKIGLELMTKCHAGRVLEMPIHFASRAAGKSKLTIHQQFKYLEHLSRLYDFCFPRGSPALKFIIATAVGWLVAIGFYGLLLKAGVSQLAAPAIAYPAAMLSTAVFHLRYVRTQRDFIPSRHPWNDFFIIASAEWFTCTLASMWVYSRLRLPSPIETFGICFGAATVMRYVLRKEFLSDVRGLRKEVERGATLGDAVKISRQAERDKRREAA